MFEELDDETDDRGVGPPGVESCDPGVGTEVDVCARGTGPIVELSVEATELECGEVCRELGDAKAIVLDPCKT